MIVLHFYAINCKVCVYTLHVNLKNIYRVSPFSIAATDLPIVDYGAQGTIIPLNIYSFFVSTNEMIYFSCPLLGLLSFSVTPQSYPYIEKVGVKPGVGRESGLFLLGNLALKDFCSQRQRNCCCALVVICKWIY